MAKRKMIEIDGKVKSISAWAKFYGKSRHTVFGRIARGWDVVEAIKEPMSFRGRMITANGKTRTLRNWAKVIGIHERSMWERVNTGNEKAITAPKRQDRGMTAFGKTQSYQKWADETGIARMTIVDRIHRGKLTPEVALTLPVKANRRQRKPKEKKRGDAN